MMQRRDRLIGGAAATVRVASIANRVFLAAIAAGLVATWWIPGFIDALLAGADPAMDAPAALPGIRFLMLIGIGMAIATDRLLIALSAIVSSAGEGDPFGPGSARALQTIGWALLMLQLLDICGALVARFWHSLGTAAPDGDISVAGWIATLMVFVLARVFAAGSAMRDDLAGTV
nr:DUF2975 domain-containing protein [Sphingomonas bacterium]